MRLDAQPVASPAGTGPARAAHYLGAGLALVLIALVIVAAGPAQVWRILSRTDPGWCVAAGLGAALAILLRGLRLVLLLPARRLGPGQGALVAAAAQAAALFLPLRLGELALPWLLRRTAAWDATAGVGTLLVARTFDLVALGAWASAGVVLLWGVQSRLALAAAAALLAPPLMLPLLLRTADRLALCLLAPRGVRGRKWARRVRRLSRALEEVKQHPRRLAAAALASLAMWGLIWAYTWLLLQAMGFPWPFDKVVAGSAAASLANLIPVNLIANLGTLEAGWTAAFHALGYSIEDAAASGLAAHFWALLFAAAYGACAWIVLASRDRSA